MTKHIGTRAEIELFEAVRKAAKAQGHTSSSFTRLKLLQDESVRAILNETKPKTKGTK